MGEVIPGPWPLRPAGSDNHPAGRKRRAAAAAELPMKWRSQYPSDTEARRAAALAAKPHCCVCEVPFARNATPPADRLCRACRADLERNTIPVDPPLF